MILGDPIIRICARRVFSRHAPVGVQNGGSGRVFPGLPGRWPPKAVQASSTRRVACPARPDPAGVPGDSGAW